MVALSTRWPTTKKWLLLAVLALGALFIYSQHVNVSNTTDSVVWLKQQLPFHPHPTNPSIASQSQRTNSSIGNQSQSANQSISNRLRTEVEPTANATTFVFSSYVDRRFYNASKKKSQISTTSVVVRLLVLRDCQQNSDPVDDMPPLLLTTAAGKRQSYDNWTYVNVYNNQCPWLWAPACPLHAAYLQTTVPIKDYQSSKALRLSGLPLHPHPVLLPNHASPLPHRLAVCVPPLYLFADAALLTAFLHVWTQLGATWFIVYHVSISQDVLTVLLGQAARVQLVAWPALQPGVYRFGHVLALNDCVHRTAALAEYVAQVDVDEYMLPTGQPGRSLLDLVRTQFARHPSAAGLLFQHRGVYFNRTLRFSQSTGVSDMRWLRQVKCANRTGPSKVILRPRLVSVMATHSVVRSLSAQRHTPVPVRQAALYHVRITNPLSTCHKRSSKTHCVPCGVFDPYIPSPAKVDDDRTRLAPLNLTPDAVYKRVYEPVVACLSQSSKTGCKEPHARCSHVLNDSTVRWSIVNMTAFVNVEPGLYILPDNDVVQ